MWQYGIQYSSLVCYNIPLLCLYVCVSAMLVEKKDLDRLEEYTRNTQWLLENMDDLRKQYPDRYVAVCDSARGVVEAVTLEELLSKLSNSGRDSSSCAIEFISQEKYLLIV